MTCFSLIKLKVLFIIASRALANSSQYYSLVRNNKIEIYYKASKNWRISNQKFHRTKPSVTMQSFLPSQLIGFLLFRFDEFGDKLAWNRLSSLRLVSISFCVCVCACARVYEFRLFQTSLTFHPETTELSIEIRREPRPRASSWNSKSKVPPCRVHRTDGHKDTNILLFFLFNTSTWHELRVSIILGVPYTLASLVG